MISMLVQKGEQICVQHIVDETLCRQILPDNKFTPEVMVNGAPHHHATSTKSVPLNNTAIIAAFI